MKTGKLNIFLFSVHSVDIFRCSVWLLQYCSAACVGPGDTAELHPMLHSDFCFKMHFSRMHDQTLLLFLNKFHQSTRKNGTSQRFHFHFWSLRRMRITHVGLYHTRPASTNTQLSSAASWLLNDCWFLLQITVGELREYVKFYKPVKIGNPIWPSAAALIS